MENMDNIVDNMYNVVVENIDNFVADNVDDYIVENVEKYNVIDENANIIPETSSPSPKEGKRVTFAENNEYFILCSPTASDSTASTDISTSANFGYDGEDLQVPESIPIPKYVPRSKSIPSSKFMPKRMNMKPNVAMAKGVGKGKKKIGPSASGVTNLKKAPWNDFAYDKTSCYRKPDALVTRVQAWFQKPNPEPIYPFCYRNFNPSRFYSYMKMGNRTSERSTEAARKLVKQVNETKLLCAKCLSVESHYTHVVPPRPPNKPSMPKMLELLKGKASKAVLSVPRAVDFENTRLLRKIISEDVSADDQKQKLPGWKANYSPIPNSPLFFPFHAACPSGEGAAGKRTA